MKPEEIRIGNWINWFENDTILTEDMMRVLCGNTVQDEDVKPIELKSEWLEKLGFKLGQTNPIATIGNFTLDVIESCGNTDEGIDIIYYDLEAWLKDRTGKRIYYVHELQNLYNSLTGEELKIKELVK